MAGLLPDPLGALQIEVEAAMALVDRLQTARTDALRLCGSVVATLR